MRKAGLCGGLLLWSVGAFAASTTNGPAASKAKTSGVKINGVTYSDHPAAANANGLPPDQALRLKKIFLFPSIDDLSGAVAPKLDEKLASLFNHNTRFELIRDPQVVKALSPDEASYYKAALSPEVHKEAAKVTGADTTVLLRTRNVGPDTRMTLELRDAEGGMLFSEEGSVLGTAKMDARWDLIEKLYRGVLGKLPFEGTITGRTAATVTVDLGAGSARQGEIIELARIVSLQRHPLLGSVVGTDYVRTGRAKVTTVDRVLSFADVIEEFPGEKVSPGQKVLRQQASLVHRGGAESEGASPPRAGKKERRLEGPSANSEERVEGNDDERLKGNFERARPRYGKVGGNLQYGSLSHSQTVNDNNYEFGGSGIGGELVGELWITKSIILSLDYGFHGASMTGSSAIVNNADLGSTSWRNVEVLAGLRILPEGVGEGLVITGSVGYQSMKFDIPTNNTYSVGQKKYSGPLVRVDGELSFLDNQTISGGFSIAPISTMRETGPSLGDPNHGMVIGLNLGWNHLLLDQLWLRVGGRYDIASASYEGLSSTISDKHFAIGPGIYYLF